MEPFVRRLLSRLRGRKSAILIILSICILLLYILRTPRIQPSQDTSTVTKHINGSAEHNNSILNLPIINPYPFNFTHVLSSPCQDERLVFAVHSAVNYHLRRMLLRNTWLNSRDLDAALGLKVKVVFVTGATLNETVQKYLEYEHELYGDIIQSSFIDSYENNTHKALSYMRWVTSPYGCPNASLIMKVDDDALIHPLKIPQLNRTVHDLLGTQEPDLYSGRLLTRLVNRNNASKWYIPYDLWPEKLYPVWFQGLVYTLTPHLAAQLYPIALRTRYMFTDDVYVGILVSKVLQAKVIINEDLGYHTDGNNFTLLEREYRNGFHMFHHVPNHKLFFKWYIRDDIRVRERPKPSDKSVSSPLLVLIVILSIVGSFLCLLAIAVYFLNDDAD